MEKDLKNLQEDFTRQIEVAQWQIVHVDFPATADTDATIPHKLNPPDPEYIDFRVINSSGPALVYKDLSSARKPWGNNFIVLRSGVESLKADILLTVPILRRDLRQRYEGGGKTLGRGVLPGAIAYEDEANTFTAAGNNFDEILAVDKGLQFPATQVASAGANVLDDYEEGSWTPALGGDGGQSGQVYTTQTGRYIKIGRCVHVSGRITLSTLGTITGNVIITGLPFTVENTADVASANFGFYAALTTAVVWLGGYFDLNATRIFLRIKTAASTSSTTAVQGDLSNTTDLTFSGTYMTAS